MPFSHHSHSGQFCPGHAKNTLEEVIQKAISLKMQVFALTEHMPRHEHDRYPEEIEAGSNLESAFENQAQYIKEALRLRQKYSSQIELPLGFEGEWCGPHSQELIKRSLNQYNFDFFIGSIHHVGGVPIDYDQASYDRAREAAGGTDEKLFKEYFDEQLLMLQTLQPPVIGHFDLIRLLSSDFNVNLKRIPGVWNCILRNLEFVSSYGGILEINTAALRKGMDEPYPNSDICQAFLRLNGRFCLSDDSHGVDQIATNYHHVIPYLRRNEIPSLYFLKQRQSSDMQPDSVSSGVEIKEMRLDEVQSLPFFSARS